MDKLSQSLEDYLEAIYMISRSKKIVRVKDLAKKLDVRTASVIGALKKLSNFGLVEHEHYGYVALTPQGVEQAAQIYEKHAILHRFLMEVIGVDKETAEVDACKIEHHISKASLDGIKRLMEKKDTGAVIVEQE